MKLTINGVDGTLHEIEILKHEIARLEQVDSPIQIRGAECLEAYSYLLIRELFGQIKGRTSDGTGDFCQRTIGLVCVRILHGARLGAWYLGHGTIVGDGVARAAVILTGRDA